MNSLPVNACYAPHRRGGFTLIEIIVMLGIMAILVSVVVRTVGPRLNRGEAAAIMNGMDSLNLAVRRFRANVGQYPSELRQLSQPPGTTPNGESAISSNGLCGTAVTATTWGGPYLDQRSTATGLVTASAVISNTITRVSKTSPASSTVGAAELVLSAAEVQSGVADLIDRGVDGVADPAAGMVQYTSPTLSYHIPINGC